MQRLNVLALVSALTFVPALYGQDETRGEAAAKPAEPELPALTTSIAGVTLFSDQALVWRRGAVELPAGRSHWEVTKLPAALRDEAVRARIVAGNGALLANLEVLLRHKTVFKKKEAEEADKKLKEIQARHKRASDAIATLDKEAALLKSIEVGRRPEGRPEKPSPIPIDVGAWAATLKFIDEGLTGNRRRARELFVELDGIEEELAVAAAQAQKLASAKVSSDKSVLLEFEAAAPAKVEVEIAYLVPGPGWWPRYDIRADVDAGKVEVVSYALVRQETGEDWEGVELSFSAAEPARAADLPELLAWHIGERDAAQTSSLNLAQQASSRVNPFNISSSAGGIRPQGQMDQAQQSLSEQPAPLFPQFEWASNLKQTAASANVVLAQKDKDARNRPASKAARTQEVLKRLEDQKAANDAAAQRNDWQAFNLGNRLMIEDIQNLSPRYQEAFAFERAGCEADIARGERLLKSARLADGIVPPVQSSRGYDYKYRALRPESIPSDGAFNKVVVGAEEFKAEFVYEAAPALRELCFLATRIRNQRRQPYLEGPASVFLASDFVGDGRVPTTARGEEFPVNLGADESVAVKRREDPKRETTGFFTSYHKYHHDVEVLVKNQKTRPVKVVVIDRVPFSEDPSVTVERGVVSPAAAREERKGLLRWEFTLAPGGEKQITFAYSVELPADKRLVSTVDETVRW